MGTDVVDSLLECGCEVHNEVHDGVLKFKVRQLIFLHCNSVHKHLWNAAHTRTFKKVARRLEQKKIIQVTSKEIIIYCKYRQVTAP